MKTSKKKLIDPEITAFYTEASEAHRLEMGLGPLEFERNKQLIQHYLPKKKSVVLDVGGGPGVYAEWLTEKKHEVYLIDPVEKHIQEATKRSNKLKNKFTPLLGEARNLNFPDRFADVVILHGPLYHLQKKSERLDCLKEAKRVLKPGGIVLGFAINYTASTMVAMIQGVLYQQPFFDMCTQELKNGIHQAPKHMPGILPKAFYHKQEELKEEFETVTFKYLDTHAVEGMVWLDKDYFKSRSDAAKNKKMMELLAMTETDKNLLSFSPHMMIAAKK
jgi:ubiquinone/menaquinone biosynthesis C-methylase UbiE